MKENQHKFFYKNNLMEIKLCQAAGRSLLNKKIEGVYVSFKETARDVNIFFFLFYRLLAYRT